MSKSTSRNTRRSRKRAKLRQSKTAGASGARGASGPSPDSSKKKDAPIPSKADEKKQRKADQTGRLIVASWKGTRLEPLIDIVASHSKQIVTVIEETATSMLDLRLEIADRLTSLARFDLKIKDKDTGKEDLFAPSCCRLKNPVTGSQVVKDTEEHKAIVAEYQKIQDKYKAEARTLLKNSAKLEVESREKKLKELLTDTLIRLSRNLAIEEMIKEAKQGKVLELSQHQHALKAARHFLNGDKMTEEELTRYLYPSKIQLRLDFDRIIASGKEATTMNVLLNSPNEDDKALSNRIVEKLWTFFPNMTVDLWKTVEEEELMREINAAQESFNKKDTLDEATRKAAELLTQDQPVTQSQMEGLLAAQVNKQLKKHRVSWDKKSTAESKSQGSAKERSGQKSNNHSPKQNEKRSNSSSPKSTKKSKGTHQKSTPKSGRKPSKGGRGSNQGRGGRGGRGGRHSGGRGRR